MFEKKYKIIFLRKEYSTMNLVGMYKSNKISNVIRFNGKTYNVSVDKPSFSEQKTKVFIIDFDSGSQLIFEEIKALLNPNELDLIVSNQIIKELTAGAISDKREKIMNMIIGAIMGGLLSAILMFFYMNSKIAEIYESMNFTVVSP